MRKTIIALTLFGLIASLAVGSAAADRPGSPAGPNRQQTQGEDAANQPETGVQMRSANTVGSPQPAEPALVQQRTQAMVAHGSAQTSRAPAAGLDGVVIHIAPKVLVVGGNAPYVTVHANIPLAEVKADSLALNGIAPVSVAPVSVFADAQGNLVAKFCQRAIEDLEIVVPPEATLTLTGTDINDQPFSGSAVIRVKLFSRVSRAR